MRLVWLGLIAISACKQSEQSVCEATHMTNAEYEAYNALPADQQTLCAISVPPSEPQEEVILR